MYELRKAGAGCSPSFKTAFSAQQVSFLFRMMTLRPAVALMISVDTTTDARHVVSLDTGAASPKRWFVQPSSQDLTVDVLRVVKSDEGCRRIRLLDGSRKLFRVVTYARILPPATYRFWLVFGVGERILCAHGGTATRAKCFRLGFHCY